MWKKIVLGVLIAMFLGVSYSRYQAVNIYDVPRVIYAYHRHFNQDLNDHSVGPAPDFKKRILTPTIKKIRVTGNHGWVMRVTVPYHFNCPFKDSVYKHVVNLDNAIRVKAGGTVWQINPHANIVVTPKHPQAIGKVTIDMPIDESMGFTEAKLRNYHVYFLFYPNETAIHVELYNLS